MRSSNCGSSFYAAYVALLLCWGALIRSLLLCILVALVSFHTVHAQKSNTGRPTQDLRTARERADEFAKLGDLKLAHLHYEQWLSAMPRDTIASFMHAVVLMKLAQPELALSELERASLSGLTDTKKLNEEVEFAPLKQLTKWHEVLERVQQNEREQSEFVVRYTRQERIGRYRVLYPSRYDTLRQYDVVLLLHGNGQTPNIMLRWARDLHLSDVIFICPEAPYTKFPETLAHGMTQLSASPNDLFCPDTIRPAVVDLAAQWYVDVLSDAQKQLPLRRGLPIIIGFSQGGFYASVVASRYPERFRSVVLLSASYYDEGKLKERGGALRRYGIDVLQTHGRQDPIVPFQSAELLHNVFISQGVETTYVPYEGVHWMTSDINVQVVKWLQSHFQRVGNRE